MLRPGCDQPMMPLHKLSQWLSYSLIEPLQHAGIEVTDIDGLTALPNIAMADCSSMAACSHFARKDHRGNTRCHRRSWWNGGR